MHPLIDSLACLTIGEEIAQQLQYKSIIQRQFEEPAEVVTMNTQLLGKIARESEEVDVSHLMGRLPAPPKRVLIKQREARVQIGGRGNLRS